MYYLRFPATAFRRFGTRDQTWHINVNKNSLTVSITNMHPYNNVTHTHNDKMINYYFDNNFHLIKLPGLGDNYKRLLMNRLNIPAEQIKSDDYKNVLFWNGKSWNPKPSVNENWQKLVNGNN